MICIEVHGFGDAGHLIKIAQVTRQFRIVRNSTLVALEMADIHRVETHQRCKETPIRLRQTISNQETLRPQTFFEEIQGFEQFDKGFLVGFLRGGEAGFVDPVIHLSVDACIQGVDFRSEFLGIKVACRRTTGIEGRVEHPDDFGGVVVHDGLGSLVPKHRHSNSPCIARLGPGIDFVEKASAVERIGNDTRPVHERPAIFPHEPVHDREVDHLCKPLELSENQCSMRPWAGERDVEVVAPGLCLETTRAAWPWRAIGRNPIPEG